MTTAPFTARVEAREYVDKWTVWWLAEGDASDRGPMCPRWATPYEEKKAKEAGRLIAELTRKG